MRRLLFSSFGSMAFTSVALAADLSAPPPPPPPPNWTGYYIGINAGYQWANNLSVPTTTVPVFASPAGAPQLALSAALATNEADNSASGFIGGGQIGYNYQFTNPWVPGSWVAGLEADIQGIAENATSGTFTTSGTPAGAPAQTIFSTVQSSKSLDYLGTLRGRIGYLLLPSLLVFIDGGLAYGGVSASTSISQANLPFSPAFTSYGSLSQTLVGWTLGGGIEWQFLPNWSFKADYLYYDLGKKTFQLSALSFSSPGLNYSSAPFSSARFNGNVVRAGVNYHFNWGVPAPLVAKY